MQNRAALAVGFIGLLIGVPIQAIQADRFAYTFVTTPEEGPLNPAIESRYSQAWRACQARAVSTQAHEACFVAEFARHDKALNQTWRAALGRLKGKSRARLIEAQHDWIAGRDPFCVLQADKFRGGTISPVIYVDCRVEQTIRRTMWLERLR